MDTISPRVLNLDYIPLDITRQQESDKTLSAYFAQSFQGFRILDLVEGDVLASGNIPNNHFIFLLEGKALLSLNGEEPLPVSDGQMALVTLDMKLRLTACCATRIIIHTFSSLLPECEEQVNSLYRLNSSYTEHHTPVVPLHPLIRAFGLNVYEIIKYGKMTPTYMRLKRLEIFTLIALTRSTNETLSFFYPLLNKRYSFRTMVMNTDYRVSTEELIARSGLCRTNFYNRFKREFGMSVSRWLKLRRAYAVREAAGFPGMNVKELMSSTGFTSPSNFIRFCDIYFGCSPKALIASIRNGCMPAVLQAES